MSVRDKKRISKEIHNVFLAEGHLVMNICHGCPVRCYMTKLVFSEISFYLHSFYCGSPSWNRLHTRVAGKRSILKEVYEDRYLLSCRKT